MSRIFGAFTRRPSYLVRTYLWIFGIKRRQRPEASPAMEEVLDGAEREIALWQQAPERIAYLLVLARPR